MPRENNKKTTTHWARLSVGYYRDPKLIEVGVIGEVAFVRLLALARETVENAEESGTVSYVLAARELRDISDLYSQLNPGKKLDDLLAELVEVRLISRKGKVIMVEGYTSWQTTREEIDNIRVSSQQRVAAHRARKDTGETNPFSPTTRNGAFAGRAAANQPATSSELKQASTKTDVSANAKVKTNTAKNTDTSTQTNTQASVNKTKTGGKQDMALYETEVGAFEDLRDEGKIKAGKKTVGKHGLPPQQVADAERIVDHLSKVRKETLGGNFKVTPTWWSDTKKLLNGAGSNSGLTADQICDVIEYAMADKFWHAHCQTPGALARHAHKLFASDEYIQWSLSNGKPESNRPRNTLISSKGKPTFRGKLKADEKVDWSNESGEL